MEAKQNPFSVYDFLGYLIPGAFFLYGSFIFFKILSSGRIDPSILSSLIFEKNEYYVPFVLFAYMLGHCLSFISSITIEKYSVWRYGYPSAYLFNVHPKPYFEVDKHRGIRTSYRSSVAIFILPVTLLDYVLGHCMSMHELYARSLDKDLVDLLEKKLARLVTTHDGQYSGVGNTDWFRLAYHHVLENSEGHRPKLQNYVALYGFLRTATLNAVICFWAVSFLVFKEIIIGITALIAVALAVLAAFLLFMAFIKFYRRFTLEALMALAILSPCEH